jgi:hypothetical protein
MNEALRRAVTMHIGLLLLATSTQVVAQTGATEWFAQIETNPEATGVEVTLWLNMESTEPWEALSATIFDTLNTAGAEYGSIVGWEVHNQLACLTGDLTTTDGTSLYNTHAGQLFPFAPFTSANPIDVLSFQWSAHEGYRIADEGQAVAFATLTQFMFLWVGEDQHDNNVHVIEVFDITEGVFGWHVVPPPSTIVACLIPCLTAVRRTRRSR